MLNKETMRIEESLNVTFDESLPEPKSSPSVEDDRINEPIVQDLNGSPSLQVNDPDEGYPKSVKEARVVAKNTSKVMLLPYVSPPWNKEGATSYGEQVQRYLLSTFTKISTFKCKIKILPF
ncbi:hypothetical protein Tco_0958461 [Tanacetum coccineum]